MPLNNSRFGDFLHLIYPSQLEIKDATDTVKSASYFDLHLEIDTRGRSNTKLYDKRDDLDFPIVNFPFLSGNIPEALAYGVYISQLIRYSRACDINLDFIDRARLLTQKLLNQGYVAPNLQSSFLKFYGRHHDLVAWYDKTVPNKRNVCFLSLLKI